MKLLGRKLVKSLAVGFFSSFFVLFFWRLELWNSWQNKLADKLFLSRPASQEIIIVAIDQLSLSELGQWPWPRAYHARLLEELALGQPRVVGYDVMFSEASRQGSEDDKVLAEALKKIPVVFPVEAAPLRLSKKSKPNAEKLIKPLEIFEESVAAFGVVNVLADEDGVVRALPVSVFSPQGDLPSFSLAVSRLAGIQTEGKTEENDFLRINFVGPPGSFRTFSFSDVYHGRVNPSEFKNKIVLVGVTSVDLHDNQMTPFSLGQAMAGIEIHANALDTILTQKYLKKATAWLTSFFVLAFGLSNSLFFSLLRRFWLAGLASVLALLAYLLLALIYFERGLIFDLVYPILAWGLSLLAVLFFQYFSEAQEKKYLKRSFQYYLAPAVVKEIIKDPASLKLGGQKKDVTIMFADLRNFTSLSEKLAPEVLVSLLNEYFTAMAEIILAEGGVLDKFIGDAIMAFWGAPQETKDHSQRACRVALAMVKKLAELDKTWVSSGKPPLEVGIGINTGQVVVGNMGSEKRFDYTVIGDHVNLASRLEGLNKSYGTKIIISEFTKARVENEFILRPLDEVKVKGKEIPVEIFELIGEKS